MSRSIDLVLAASAPAVWGSSYIVTTQMLPDGYPLTVAALRALPAGLLLLILTRQFPPRNWWGKLIILGALNFSLFWAALFYAAYHLPGGIAATLGAIQPLFVLFLARIALGTPLSPQGLIAAIAGIGGVALLVMGPEAKLDGAGVIIALAGALSMAVGVVLTKKWQPPASALTFTAWQLIAGGLLLTPVAWIIEPPLPVLTETNITGFIWLGLIGAALTYFLWFRAIERLGPAKVTSLGFLSPMTAVLLGWFLLDETLTIAQISGAGIVLICIALGTTAKSAPVK